MEEMPREENTGVRKEDVRKYSAELNVSSVWGLEGSVDLFSGILPPRNRARKRAEAAIRPAEAGGVRRVRARVRGEEVLGC